LSSKRVVVAVAHEGAPVFVPQFCPRCGQALADVVKFGKPHRCCPACEYIHFSNPKVAAAVFIEQTGRVLLVKRGVDPEKGKWALPAGFIDYGEDPQAAARRETLEETGLTVSLTRLVDVLFDGTTIVIIYAATVNSGTLTAADDVEETRWFGPDELPELAFKSTQQVIHQWRGDG
jgi:ADP-ribose pyrophosphatase YjhB (NUDIX family)